MPKSSKRMTKTTLVDSTSTGNEDVEFKIIKVSPETHKKLLKLGGKSETFDQIINRLIDAYEEKKHEGAQESHD
jgi:hypothetical protein